MEHVPTTNSTQCLTEGELSLFLSKIGDIWERLSDTMIAVYTTGNGTVYWEWMESTSLFCVMKGLPV